VALLIGQTDGAARGRRMRGVLRVWLSLALLCASAAHGQTQATEVSLKSAFLYKFIHYADWPDQAFAAVQDPIAVCVVEQQAFADALESAVSGRIAHERPVVVRRVASPSEIGGCHVLFVGALEPERIEQLIARVSDQPTLTIGDTEGFAQRGGMINFTRRGSRLGFEINRGAVRRAGLDLSSQLLKLAELIPGQGGGE